MYQQYLTVLEKAAKIKMCHIDHVDIIHSAFIKNRYLQKIASRIDMGISTPVSPISREIIYLRFCEDT